MIRVTSVSGMSRCFAWGFIFPLSRIDPVDLSYTSMLFHPYMIKRYKYLKILAVYDNETKILPLCMNFTFFYIPRR